MREERSFSLSFLIHASPGHAPCPPATSVYSFSFYPALLITPLPEDCRPTCNPLPPREGLCCRGPLLWVQSPRQILALSLTERRSPLVDCCGSVAVSRSLWVGRCGSIVVGRSLWIGRCGLAVVGWPLWVGRCGLAVVGWPLWVGRCECCSSHSSSRVKSISYRSSHSSFRGRRVFNQMRASANVL